MVHDHGDALLPQFSRCVLGISRIPAGIVCEAGGVDSLYAYLRLAVSVLLSTIGGVAMWSIAVVL